MFALQQALVDAALFVDAFPATTRGYRTPAERIIAGLLYAAAPEVVAGYTSALLTLAGQWHSHRKADERDICLTLHMRLSAVAQEAAEAQHTAARLLYDGAADRRS